MAHIPPHAPVRGLCAEHGCSFRKCLSLDSDRCFKHTPGNEHVKHWKIMARVGLDPSTVA